MYEDERTTSQERLYETLKLIAENDGDSYRDNNPVNAVYRAMQSHKATVLEGLEEDFLEIADDLVNTILRRWVESRET